MNPLRTPFPSKLSINDNLGPNNSLCPNFGQSNGSVDAFNPVNVVQRVDVRDQKSIISKIRSFVFHLVQILTG